jgi:hypothetical protein
MVLQYRGENLSVLDRFPAILEIDQADSRAHDCCLLCAQWWKYGGDMIVCSQVALNS